MKIYKKNKIQENEEREEEEEEEEVEEEEKEIGSGGEIEVREGRREEGNEAKG